MIKFSRRSFLSGAPYGRSRALKTIAKAPGRILPFNGRSQALKTIAKAPRMDRYPFYERIGRGAAATVWRSVDPETGRGCAVKKFNHVWNMKNEAECLRCVKHPNVLQVIEEIPSPNPMLVLELAAVSLETLLEQLRKSPDEATESPLQLPPPSGINPWIRQLLAGLDHAHSQGWVHCDIKPGNLLLTDRGELKIADWDGARKIRSRAGQTVGTITYWAPEVLAGERGISPARDMWAVGCVLAELLLGKPLFYGRRADDTLASVRSVLDAREERSPLSIIDPTAKSLIDKLLSLDPDQRPSAKFLMDDPFFK